MFDLMEKAVEKGLLLGATYIDIRVVKNASEEIKIKNSAVEEATIKTDSGFGVRVLKNGAWGFHSSNKIDKHTLDQVVETAVKIAEASATRSKKPVKLAPVKTIKDKWRTPWIKDPFDVPFKDKLELFLEADETIREQSDYVKVSMVSYEARKIHKWFVSSEGSKIEAEIVFCGVGVSALATKNGDVQRRSLPTSFGGNYVKRGWEYVKSLNLVELAERVGKEATMLLDAKSCPSGKTTLILDSSQLALQIHESCGHPSEADRVLGTEASYAGTSFLTPDKLGKLKYGSEIVNIVMDPSPEKYPEALGSYKYDDEGVPVKRTYIVKEGVFTGYQLSRETAVELGFEESNGAMRADNWNRIPLIRMSLISLEPGDWKSEEIIEDTKDGIYMETNRSWSIDDKRLNFQFGCELAWKIEKGEKKELLKNPVYQGITPEFWGNCDAIGKDFFIWGIPNCGKGEPQQIMWVSHGASTARFRNVMVFSGR